MPEIEHLSSSSEEQTREAAADLSRRLSAGDIVLLEGPLGAGKTTFVRGLVAALGFDGPVRSPTFNLIQTFPTNPPVMHADLYRVSSYEGIGLEEYLPDHISLIEWPDRARGLVDPNLCWRVKIEFSPAGREITISEPSSAP